MWVVSMKLKLNLIPLIWSMPPTVESNFITFLSDMLAVRPLYYPPTFAYSSYIQKYFVCCCYMLEILVETHQTSASNIPANHLKVFSHLSSISMCRSAVGGFP